MSEVPPASGPSESGRAPETTTPQMIRVELPHPTPYVTYILMGSTIFVFALQLISIAVFGRLYGTLDLLEVYGGMLSDAVRAGQLWRLFTPIFLHDNQNLLHIAFNMYALYIFGTPLERHFGHKRFFLLYLLGAFSGNVAQLAFASPNSVAVGASTSIFGLMGAEAVLFYQNRKLFATQFKRVIGNTIFFVIANLLIGSSIGAGNWGHIGGLLGGSMFAWFASPVYEVEGVSPDYRLVDKRSFNHVIVGIALVIIVFGALAMWGMIK